MELGLREWLIIFGIVVLAVVILDGFRQVRRRRREQIRLKIGKGIDPEAFPDDETCGGELLGHARVVEVDTDGDPAPMLMDTVADRAPARGNGHDNDGDRAGFSALDPDDVPPRRGQREEPVAPRQRDDVDTGYARGDDAAHAPSESQMAPETLPPVIALHVLALEGDRFGGGQILQVLLSSGLQFGDMNIFHRHEEENGQGAVLFSVANAVEPGVFDLDHIDQLRTPGLSFFMELGRNVDPVNAFEFMVDSARYASRMLGGQLCDERRSELTPETVERCRAWTREAARQNSAVSA